MLEIWSLMLVSFLDVSFSCMTLWGYSLSLRKDASLKFLSYFIVNIQIDP